MTEKGKSPLPKPSEVEYEIFFACDPEKTRIMAARLRTLRGCEHKVPPLRGNLFGNLGEFGSKGPEQGEKLLLSSSGYRSEGVNRARSGGIDQGIATSHQEVETKISFR